MKKYRELYYMFKFRYIDRIVRHFHDLICLLFKQKCEKCQFFVQVTAHCPAHLRRVAVGYGYCSHRDFYVNNKESKCECFERKRRKTLDK